MTRRLSLLVSWGCSVLSILLPVAALFFLIDLSSFEQLVRNSIGLPVQWQTVSNGQWYGLWALMALYVSIGLVGLYFLRRAFANFANGELFNLVNSRDLRRFSILLLVQAIVTPLHYALSSVLLSLNHPAGEKMLSISFGSNEMRTIGVALVLWVMSNLLVEGSKLQTENRQFV